MLILLISMRNNNFKNEITCRALFSHFDGKNILRSDQAHSYDKKHKPSSCCGENEQRSLSFTEIEYDS